MRPDQDDRNLRTVPEVGHFGIVGVDGVEAGLVLQAKHEDDGVDPGGELEEKEKPVRSQNSFFCYFRKTIPDFLAIWREYQMQHNSSYLGVTP